MNMERIKRQNWVAWSMLGLLAASCAALAVLQYRWIGEISVAERERLKEALETNLGRLSRDFNRELSATAGALFGDPADDDEAVAESFTARYRQWRETAAHPDLVKRLALVTMHDGKLALYLLESNTGEMKPADWPAAWSARRDRFVARLAGEGFGPRGADDPFVFELPRLRFRGPGEGGGPLFGPGGPREWVLVEFDPEVLRQSLLREQMRQHLGANTYDAVFLVGDQPLFGETLQKGRRADGRVRLFELDMGDMFRRMGGRGGRFAFGGRNPSRGPGPGGPGFGSGGPGPGGPGGGPGGPGGPPPMGGAFAGRGRWEMQVFHRGGSLDAIVDKARLRNLLVSGGIFLLMLATALALVRVSRRSQQLAELQMNFVAGVSHELRTPLTVIRTAGHNLQGRLASRPEHVERYGKLIQDESEKLTALVEQVLRFASARAGHVIREKEPAQVAEMIEAGLRSSRAALEKGRLEVERAIAPDLPVVLADSLALKHAFQNLVDNAIKYGTETSNWIGIGAEHKDGQIEVTVADRGPGIPANEIPHLFDPFFRGRRAIQDQVHGTGLGLNLVKEIVVAHGGSIDVASEPGQGTRFIVRLPVAPAEYQDEFAHTAG